MLCVIRGLAVPQTIPKYLAIKIVGERCVLVMIGNKWKANVSVARMNDVHILREMIEIRDGFKECCILSKEDVSDIIENLTGFFNLY